MIGYIYGDILDTTDKALVIDTGGIRYIVSVTDRLREKLMHEKRTALFTYLAVREDALDLYGFETQEEKRLFELLTSVSGIGPRSALGIIGLAPLETLVSAVRAGDSTYLTRVSGIGKKTAEKIIIELRDKPDILAMSTSSSKTHHQDTDVLDALLALGYKEHMIRDAMKEIPRDAESTNDRIKHAIRLLGK